MYTSQPIGVVQIEKPGPSNVLTYHTLALPQLGPGEVLLHQKAIGVNFVDVFFRNGTFPMEAYPAPVGLEAAGVIEAVGPGVTALAVGDRVAYHFLPGAYAEKRVLPASALFRLPADISFAQAASVMIKGLTAHMLLKQSHALQAGDVVLVHAMTGGVGTLLSSWARALGATVIGTVGSAAKKELAHRRGFAHVVNLQAEDFAATVRKVTHGEGLDAVYDSIGAATFQKSLELVKEGGSAVLYGWPSGMPVIDTKLIEQRKIHYVHPALNDYLGDQEKIATALTELFELVRNGTFEVQVPTVYTLADAATAHADLEARKTTGSIILQS
jgi:NADPH2:quinone reductase